MNRLNDYMIYEYLKPEDLLNLLVIFKKVKKLNQMKLLIIYVVNLFNCF